MPKTLSRDDIMDIDEYAKVRAPRRKAITEMKKKRRLGVGPDATCYFESFDTMWHQIHEMLYIERGGEGQIKDELAAYNPLIPNGRELVMTLMFEIDDPGRRANLLNGLGGVEETITLSIGDDVIQGVPEDDIDRTSAEGKASAIQFLHFPFSENQIEGFKAPENKIVIGIGHEKYGHMAIMPDAMRQALATDFD
ncbi:MAG: DUF3501 family protein [Rhodospirillaceae bacterium]|jgi:hypothetical protein|nr:DUF3501 family protein [Rhodospirillaceae bacterium]